MADQELIKSLCYDDRGALKSKGECRAAVINHLILEEMVDIDEAEDMADRTMRDLNLWPDPVAEKPTKPNEPTPAAD